MYFYLNDPVKLKHTFTSYLLYYCFCAFIRKGDHLHWPWMLSGENPKTWIFLSLQSSKSISPSVKYCSCMLDKWYIACMCIFLKFIAVMYIICLHSVILHRNSKVCIVEQSGFRPVLLASFLFTNVQNFFHMKTVFIIVQLIISVKGPLLICP